ncbi:MAG: hypothetical protein FWE24_03750 [Defluviitaleaceae bacterium]|nr:hypothetical protein [Defluviitaleaceae bacterium]
MNNKIIRAVIMLSAVMLLAACTNRAENTPETYDAGYLEYADNEGYIQEKQEDDVYADVINIEPGYENVPEAVIEGYMAYAEEIKAQSLPWQEAYIALLSEYAERSIGYWFDGESPNPPGGYFMLFDIDGDGVPELIVADRFHFTTYVAAYTFLDGLIPLEVEYFYDYGTFFFSLLNRPGLGMESNEGVWNSAAVLAIDGYRLVSEISLYRGEWEENDWQAGWRINGECVTEDEHDRLYYSLFGDWQARNRVLHHEITESNILEAVFGFDTAEKGLIIGNMFFRDVNMALFFEEPFSTVLAVLGEPLEERGHFFLYDDIEIVATDWNMAASSFEGVGHIGSGSLDLFAINGINLNKTRQELITIFGSPAYYSYPDHRYWNPNDPDDFRWLGYKARLNGIDYRLDFTFDSPNYAARYFTIRRFER